MKSFKKVLAYALAATLALGSCTSVLAAAPKSPVNPPATRYEKLSNATATGKSGSVAKVYTTKGGNAGINTVKNAKSVTVPSTVTVNGKPYNVGVISASAFSKAKKATKITISKPARTITFKKNAFKGCGKNLKTVTIKITKKSQLKAQKNAFKALKKSVVIKVGKNTSAKELRKIRRALKNAGFKGKVTK